MDSAVGQQLHDAAAAAALDEQVLYSQTEATEGQEGNQSFHTPGHLTHACLLTTATSFRK